MTNQAQFPVTKKRVLVLLQDKVNLLDVAGPVQVFQTAAHYGAPYEVEFCAAQADVMSSNYGLVLANIKPLSSVSANDLLLVPGISLEGMSIDDKGLSEELRQWLQAAYQAGATITSICTGTFALGDAGLLDQRRCTSHWEVLPYLKARYPSANVLDNVLYVHDGRIASSAGITAGIDLALSIVERDFGARLSSQVARYLVIYLRRHASQSQNSIYLQYRNHLNPAIHRVQDYLIEHASESLSLQDLAKVAQMSIRSLNRSFKESLGISPIQYQQRLRLEIAANLIQVSELTIEEIAAKAGFEDARHFRRLWQRQFGTAPSASRRASHQKTKG